MLGPLSLYKVWLLSVLMISLLVAHLGVKIITHSGLISVVTPWLLMLVSVAINQTIWQGNLRHNAEKLVELEIWRGGRHLKKVLKH